MFILCTCLKKLLFIGLWNTLYLHLICFIYMLMSIYKLVFYTCQYVSELAFRLPSDCEYSLKVLM